MKKIPLSSHDYDTHHHQHESQHYDAHHDIPVIHSSKPSSNTFKSLVGKLLTATAQASASASSHASSYAAHKTADLLSHLGKAAAAGSAASSAHLSSSKQPEYESHPSSPEGYEYDTSISDHNSYPRYPDYSSIGDSEHEGTQSHNVYPTNADRLLPTMASLKSFGTSTQKLNNEPLIDSYGTSINNQQNTFNSGNYDNYKMETLNLFSGMNENLAQYQANPTDYTAPNMQLSISPSTVANSQNSNGNLFFGVNFPLDTSDSTGTNINNFNSFSSTGLNQYADNQFKNYNNFNNPTVDTKHIDFDPSNPDLNKLLGPNDLNEPLRTNNGVGFLPTPATHYDHSDYTQTDSLYSPSLRGTKRKRSPSLRIRRRRKTPLRVLKSIGYEIRRHGPHTI